MFWNTVGVVINLWRFLGLWCLYAPKNVSDCHQSLGRSASPYPNVISPLFPMQMKWAHTPCSLDIQLFVLVAWRAEMILQRVRQIPRLLQGRRQDRVDKNEHSGETVVASSQVGLSCREKQHSWINFISALDVLWWTNKVSVRDSVFQNILQLGLCPSESTSLVELQLLKS